MSTVQEKIQHLLRRAESTHSQNEAEQAILKAHELMAKHGIDSVSVDAEEQHSYEEVACRHPGNKRFRYALVNVIAPNFKCKAFTRGNTIMLFGRSTDVRIAKEVFEYAYAFARRESLSLVREMKRNYMDTTGLLNSYTTGFCLGLKEKLDSQSTALLVITPPDVNEKWDIYSEQHKMKNKKHNISLYGYAGSVHKKGVTDGRNVMNGRRLEKGA